MKIWCSLLFAVLFSTIQAKETTKNAEEVKQRISSQEASVAAEAEPSSFVGNVNVICGSFHHSSTDLTVPGPVSLDVRHFYNSESFFENWMGRVALSTNFPTRITGDIFNPEGGFQYIAAEEIGGSFVRYATKDDPSFKKERSYYVDPGVIHKGLTNCGSGVLSGKTNLKNTRYTFCYKTKNNTVRNGRWTAKLGDGTFRKYHYIYNHIEASDTAFLKFERRPNGNTLFYDTDFNTGNLKGIKAKDADKKETLLWLKFDINKKQDLAKITASNGKWAEYSFFKGSGGQFDKVNYIEKIKSSDCPTTRFSYEKMNNKYLLNRVEWPEGRFVEVTYDSKGRVKAQKAPSGKHGEKRTLWEFDYQDYHTNVKDALGRKTTYWYSSVKRLKTIQHFSGKHIYRTDCFYWGEKGDASQGRQDSSVEGNLIAKAIVNSSDKAVSTITLRYDDFGNVIRETLYGNLTGKYPHSFSMDDKGRPKSQNVERYRKYCTYSNDGFNLLLSEAEDDGFAVEYQYKPKTNLVTAKFTISNKQIKIREFFFYDNTGVMIKKIIDDGATRDYNNLQGVTEQRVTKITPVKEKGSHGVGKPATIQEYYLDLATGKEVLLVEKRFTYNTAGLVKTEEVIDATKTSRYTLRSSHDSRGRLVHFFDALGREYRYEYDDNNNKTVEKLVGAGYYTKFEYDTMNRLVKEAEYHDDGTSITTQYQYDLVGNKVASIDRYGNETRYEYDDLNRLVKTIYPQVVDAQGKRYSPTISKTYDICNNVLTETDENGHTTSYTYNIRRQPTSITYPDGTQERFEYNLNGTLLHKWDKNGKKTSYTYDYQDRVIKTEHFDASNALLATETATYNAFHKLSDTDAMRYTTNYSYDGAGRLVQTVKENTKTTFEYDALSRKTTTKEWYGPNSAITTIVDYDLADRELCLTKLDGATVHKTSMEYDIRDNKTKTISYISTGVASTQETIYNSQDLPIKIIDELGNTTTITYNHKHSDAYGNKVLQTTTTDPLGKKTISTYDTLGREVCHQERSNAGTLLAESHCFYDGGGNTTKEVEKAVIQGAVDHDYVLVRTYDALDRIIELIEQPNTSEAKRTLYTYDVTGSLKTLTKPDGIQIHHTYDSFGRVATILSTDGTISYAYSYDKNHNPISVRDAVNNITHNRSYDAFSHVTKDFDVSFSYDPLGRLSKFTLPDTSSVQYSYSDGHLKHVVRYSSSQQELYRHSYDSFDLQDHALASTLPGYAGKATFTWDKKGRNTKIATPHWSEEIPSDGFNARDNLVKATITDKKGTATCSYAYSDLSQLVAEKGYEEHNYTYDSLQNRLHQDNDQYTHDTANKLLRTASTTFSYDKNGNLIQRVTDGKTTNYRYDAFNRLIEVSQDGSFLVRYTYDSLNRRISKQTSTWSYLRWQETGFVKFLYLSEREVGTYTTQGQIQTFRTLGRGKGADIGASVAIEAGNSTYAPIHDHRGNICSLVDIKTGNCVETIRYSSFGTASFYDASGNRLQKSRSPWLFSSKRYDEETGLYYFGKRYYAPGIGRFITPDPLGFEDGPNLYAYVLNNPMTLVDPYGLSFLDTARSAWDFTCGAFRGFVGFTSERPEPKNSDSHSNEMREIAAKYYPEIFGDSNKTDAKFTQSNENSPSAAQLAGEQIGEYAGYASMFIGNPGAIVGGIGRAVKLSRSVKSMAFIKTAFNGLKKKLFTSSSALSTRKWTSVSQKGPGIFSKTFGMPKPQYTKSNLKLGQKMHKSYKAGLADDLNTFKEYRLPSGKRIDFLDSKKGIIFEYKPNNPRAIQYGYKQACGYEAELRTMPDWVEKTWEIIVETY